jgi:phosphoribosylglycinamide formyltransferase-1
MDAPGLRIAVLASGRGSNLEALLDATAAGTLAARMVGVFSDKPDCGAIALARARGVHAVAIRPRDCADRASHDRALFAEIAAVQPDLIVCAGYMRILSADALASHPGPIINVHPSLLPRYPGLDTHQRALDAGDLEHGASVHAVIPELDAGPVLARVRITVNPGDTAPSLAARLLPREHALLVATVGLLAHGRLRLGRGEPTLDGVAMAHALELDADNQLQGA